MTLLCRYNEFAVEGGVREKFCPIEMSLNGVSYDASNTADGRLSDDILAPIALVGIHPPTGDNCDNLEDSCALVTVGGSGPAFVEHSTGCVDWTTPLLVGWLSSHARIRWGDCPPKVAYRGGWYDGGDCVLGLVGCGFGCSLDLVGL